MVLVQYRDRLALEHAFERLLTLRERLKSDGADCAVWEPGAITLDIESDSSKVAVHRNGKLIEVVLSRRRREAGESLLSSPPFRFSETGLGAGRHTFIARSVDSIGNAVESLPYVLLVVAVTFRAARRKLQGEETPRVRAITHVSKVTRLAYWKVEKITREKK